MLYWCIFGVYSDLSTDIESKNRLKISLESANLQEHFSIILQVWNITCVAVMVINCISFTSRLQSKITVRRRLKTSPRLRGLMPLLCN